MLDKGKGVYINNLRIIQLLEADLNFIIYMEQAVEAGG